MTKYLLLFLLVIFFGCASEQNNNQLSKNLNESLLASNTIIQSGTEFIYAAMEEKMQRPETKDKAERWNPKMEQLEKISSDCFDYIESLKMKLRTSSVDEVFKKNNEGAELYKKLIASSKAIFDIDPVVEKVFERRLFIFSSSFDSLKHNDQLFAETFFSQVSREEAIATLSKFQNNIRISENRVVQLFIEQVDVIRHRYETFSAIIGQSSTIVRANEEVEIRAGIGAFSVAAKPEITVDGIPVAIGENGTIEYKFKAPATPGKYKKNVTIHYHDQDGMKQKITKDVEFVVAKE